MEMSARLPVGEELPDDVLRRAKAGVRDACEALIVRYEGPVFAVLSRMLIPKGRAGLVADLAQETFLRVLRGLPRFAAEGPARLSTWILTIATRVALDELRRARLVTEDIEAVHAISDHSGERRAEEGAMRAAIVRALGTLEPIHQAVLVLREYHDLDYAEIADALQIDVGTVKSRLARARQALRHVLEESRR